MGDKVGTLVVYMFIRFTMSDQFIKNKMNTRTFIVELFISAYKSSVSYDFLLEPVKMTTLHDFSAYLVPTQPSSRPSPRELGRRVTAYNYYI